MRFNKTAIVLASATLLTVAACSGGSGDGSGQHSQDLSASGSAGAGQNPDATAPAPEVEGATKGGTLTVLSSGSPATFDPTRTYFLDTIGIMRGLVTRALTQYRYDPETKDMVLVPDMAKGLGQPNEDFTEWTFELRDGLKYENGKPVKAEDIAYAVMRSFAIEELPDGPTYNTTFFLNGDKYEGPYKDGTDYKGVEVNGNKITIKMRRPFGDMPYLASFPQFTGIPESADKNPQAYGNHPLATGPYKFADYRAGSSLTLVRNEHWDPATDSTRHQYVDKWEFKWGEDIAKIDNLLINDEGKAQTTLTYDNVDAADFDKANREAADRLVMGTVPCTFMWAMDNRKIKDVDVRKAIGYAYPYRAAWRASGQVEGVTRIPSTSILPPGTTGRAEYDVLGTGGKENDPEKAKAMLKEAGKLGFELKFLYRTDNPQDVAKKDQIVEAMEKAGFKATPIATTEAQYRDDMSDVNGPQNVRSVSWCSDWPTGSAWFPAQWDKSLVGKAGSPNPAHFAEDDAQAKLDKILTMSSEKAAKAWGEFDKFIETKYYPAVVTGYAGVSMLRGSKVGGMNNNNVLGMPTLANMYVKQ